MTFCVALVLFAAIALTPTNHADVADHVTRRLTTSTDCASFAGNLDDMRALTALRDRRHQGQHCRVLDGVYL